MATPVQSVNNYYYGQKNRQEYSSSPCKDSTVVENGQLSRDAMNFDVSNKQNAPNTTTSAPHTMDRTYQDGGGGGEQAANTRHPPNIDDNRVNSDMNRYYPNASDTNVPPDEYGKGNEPPNQAQMGAYSGQSAVYQRPNYDQHGVPPNMANSNPNHMYQNYNQSPMRPSFPQNSKNMTRQPNMQMGQQHQNYPNNQRFMGPGGHGMGQQSGPTPTLNQLLQSPNPVHRYQNNYNDYSGSPNMNPNHNAQWSGPRNMPAAPYPQQSGSPYRNQGPMVDPSGMKGQQQQGPPPTSGWGPQGNYPQQQMSPSGRYNAGGPTGGPPTQYPQQYPSPQPPQQQGGPTPPPRTNSRGYPHQQPSSFQNSRVASPQRQQSPAPQGQSSSAPAATSVPPATSAAAAPPAQLSAPSTPGSATPSNEMSQELSGPIDELPSSENSGQVRTATSPAVPQSSSGTTVATATVSSNNSSSSSSEQQQLQLQQQASPLSRPSSQQGQLSEPSASHLGNVPSPVHNHSSRSMSPAVGNQNIPSSPRPSSVHSDTGSTGGSHHNSSPMPVSQQSPAAAYHNQLQQAHPGAAGTAIPNGPNSMGPPSYNSSGGQGKMPMPGMINANMPPSGAGYPPTGSPGYPQGHYVNRAANNVSAGAAGYGNSGMPHPGGNYNAAGPQYGAMGNYQPRMPNHIGQGGFNSAGFANQMPPGGHYPGYQGGTQPAAQAAAQAVVMAAANSATLNNQGSRSPHYLKQHLQQKMSNSGNAPYPSQTALGQPPYGGRPPQVASPVGGQTPSSMAPSTPLPPNSRMMSNSSAVHNSIPNSMSPVSGHSPLPTPEGFNNSSSNVPNTSATSLTQSVGTPISTSSMGNNEGAAAAAAAAPPGGHDEASQHSIASTSSSQQEQDHTDNENSNPQRQKSFKEQISHPPTPVSTLPSPGAASMSSYHDDFENASSPSWPRTPASPVYNNQVYDGSHPPHPQPPPPPHVQHPPIPHHPKRPDGLMKLYELSDDPERRIFLDKLLRFNEERGSPMTNGPTLSKQPLDLFRLYVCVKERGGFIEVTKSRVWKDISITMGTGSSASTAYALRKQYIKHLLPFECKFDRGGIDPVPLISQLESSNRKKKNNQALQSAPDGYHGMDGYPPGGYPPGQYGPGGPMPGQHINSEYPGHNQNCPPGMMPNHINSDSISVQDPFSDDMQYQRNSYPPPSQYGGSGPPPNRMGSQYPGGYNNSMPDQFNADPQQQYRRGSGGSMVQQDSAINQPPASRNIPPQQPGQPPYPGYQGGSGPYENRDRFEQPPGSAMPPPPASSNQAAQQYPAPQQRYNNQTAPPVSSGPQSAAAAAVPPPPPTPQDNSSVNNGPRPPFPPPAAAAPYNSHGAPPANQMDNHQQQAPPPPSSGAGFQGPPQMQDNCYQNYPNQQPPQGPMYNQSSTAPPKQQQQAPPPPPPSSGAAPPQPQQPAVPQANSGFQKRDQVVGGSNYPLGTQGALSTTSSKLLATITANRGSGSGTGSGSSSYPPPYPPNQFRNDQPNPGQNDPGPPPGWRDGNQYGNQGSREDWNSSRPPPASASAWPGRYGNSGMANGPVPAYPAGANNSQSQSQGQGAAAPNSGPFMHNRFNQQKLPPYKHDTRFMPQHKMLPSHPANQYNNRKEPVFPPDSVEAVPPLMVRRKTINSKDLGGVEAWRIVMALKSGLLSESTWALDVLSVLLYDDTSVLYFGLRHLPGLLEILCEHFRRILSKIFGITDDLEDMFFNMSSNKHKKMVLSDEGKLENECSRHERGLCFDYEYNKYDFGIAQGIQHDDHTTVTQTEDFSMKGRSGKQVKLVDSDDPYIYDNTDEWDRLDPGFDCGRDNWLNGGGDTTYHIQTHFSCENIKDRFTSRLKDVDKSSSVTSPASSSSSSSLLSTVESVSNQTLCNNRKRKADLTSDSKVDDNDCVKSESDALNCNDEPMADNQQTQPKYPRYRDPVVKRVNFDNFEEEAYTRDDPSLVILSDTEDDLARRCICLSNLIRNLSFIPGNDIEFSRHPGLLLIIGRLLLLHHKHFVKRPPQRNYDKDEDADFSDSCSSLHAEKEWWWDMLNVVRENALVILSNISGHLDLSSYEEDISLPLLDGLLHWSVCPSAYARDALPTMPPHSVLSPQRLSLEALCKLCVFEPNVDLVLATPPFSRINKLYGVMTKSLSKSEDPVVREFAVTLLSYFALSDSSACRIIALQGSCISLLIGFVEQAEQNALQVANTHGINMLRENPEMMGTSLDMMRRAASTLLSLAKVPDNRSLFVQYQSRLLTLVMSQILDQHVAKIVSEILFECSIEEVSSPS